MSRRVASVSGSSLLERFASPRTSTPILLGALSSALLLAACTSTEPTSQAQQIVNGAAAADATSVVWVYSILRDPTGVSSSTCTGVLIDQSAVLTARHCIQKADSADSMAPVAGATEVVVGTETPACFAGQETASPLDTLDRCRAMGRSPTRVVTPGGRGWVNDGAALREGHDMALLVFDTPFEGVEPSAVHSGAPGALIGQGVLAVGFGQNALTSPTPPTNTGVRLSRTASISAMSPTGSVATSDNLLIVGGNTTCSGDSGGPLYLTGSPPTVLGVLSFGPTVRETLVDAGGGDGGGVGQCGMVVNDFSAYASVFANQEWLTNALATVGMIECERRESCGGATDEDCDGRIDEGCSVIDEPCTSGEDCTTGFCDNNICAQNCNPAAIGECTDPEYYCQVQTDATCAGRCRIGRPGTRAINAVCNADTDCVTAACVAAGTGGNRCVVACRANDDCGRGAQCLTPAGQSCGGYCGNADGTPAERGTPRGGIGDRCMSAADCLTRDPSSGRPFECVVVGHGEAVCTTFCADSNDCAAGVTCNVSVNRCDPTPMGALADAGTNDAGPVTRPMFDAGPTSAVLRSGCGCRVGGGRASALGTLAATAMIALAARRRRRARDRRAAR